MKIWSFLAVSLGLMLGSEVQAACMVKKVIRPDGKSDPISIILPASEEKEFRDKGYRKEACGRRAADAAKFSAVMCKIAERNDPTIIGGITALYGVPPARLCQSAEKARAQPRALD